MDISIRQLGADEWQLFRDMRLKALQSDPDIFMATYAEDSARADSEWQKMLINHDTAIFAIFDKEKQIGITAIGIEWEDETKKRAVLWASWLESEYRGKGISKIMYEARLEWARQHPICEKVIVSHITSNIASKLANQKHGFIFTHKQNRKYGNANEETIYYELNLNKAK